MAKKIISLSIDKSETDDVLESCIILNCNTDRKYIDEFEVPYEFEILTSTRENENIADVIEIRGLSALYKVIDNDDCLPDVGLLDYENKELGLSLVNVTLRELYKKVLTKVFK